MLGWATSSSFLSLCPSFAPSTALLALLCPPLPQLFEYVLDYLRSARFGERDSCLPREERALGLVRREAEFYQLPELAERAAAALEQLQGQLHGQAGGLGSPRTGGGGGASERTAACGGGEGSRGCGAGCEAANVALDSLFLETGLQPGNSLGLAKAALMQQLNNAVRRPGQHALFWRNVAVKLQSAHACGYGYACAVCLGRRQSMVLDRKCGCISPPCPPSTFPLLTCPAMRALHAAAAGQAG